MESSDHYLDQGTRDMWVFGVWYLLVVPSKSITDPSMLYCYPVSWKGTVSTRPLLWPIKPPPQCFNVLLRGDSCNGKMGKRYISVRISTGRWVRGISEYLQERWVRSTSEYLQIQIFLHITKVSNKEIKGLLTFMSWIGPMNRMWFWASDAHAHNPQSQEWLTRWLSDSPQLAATQLQRSHSPHGPGFSQFTYSPHHVECTSKKRLEKFWCFQKCAKQNFELSTQAFWQHMGGFSGPISPHHPYSFFRTGSKSSLERFCFNTYFLSNLTRQKLDTKKLLASFW